MIATLTLTFVDDLSDEMIDHIRELANIWGLGTAIDRRVSPTTIEISGHPFMVESFKRLFNTIPQET